MAPFTPAPVRTAPSAPTNFCQDALDHILATYDVSGGEKALLESVMLADATPQHFHI